MIIPNQSFAASAQNKLFSSANNELNFSGAAVSCNGVTHIGTRSVKNTGSSAFYPLIHMKNGSMKQRV